MGTGRQAGGDAAAVVGGEVLVPVRLHLVGSDLPSVGPVRAPAAGAGAPRLLRELHVLEDDGGPAAALQVHAHNLPVTAPQALDRRACAQGGGCARLQDEVPLLRGHLHIHGHEGKTRITTSSAGRRFFRVQAEEGVKPGSKKKTSPRNLKKQAVNYKPNGHYCPLTVRCIFTDCHISQLS